VRRGLKAATPASPLSLEAAAGVIAPAAECPSFPNQADMPRANHSTAVLAVSAANTLPTAEPDENDGARCLNSPSQRRGKRCGSRKVTYVEDGDAGLDGLLFEFNEDDGFKTAGLKKRPKGCAKPCRKGPEHGECGRDKKGSERYSARTSEQFWGESHSDTCLKCSRVGELLLCDGAACSTTMHLACMKPPLLRVPKGLWFCPLCAVADLGGAPQSSAAVVAAAQSYAPRAHSPPARAPHRTAHLPFLRIA